MADPEPTQIQLPLVWLGLEDVPISMTNQILGQVAGDNEIILSFGQVAPPPLLGTPEERLAQAQQLSYVSVRVITRLALTHKKLQELVRVLQETLANYDKMPKEGSA